MTLDKEQKKIEVGGLEWFYREVVPLKESNKTPVLLLHGIPAQSYTWRGLMSGLAERGFRAIAPDWIGTGLSAKPDRRNFAYTPDAYLSALAELIDALNLETFSLVVQGFLGSVGLQYALRHPDQIERLVILNTPLSTTVKVPWQIRQWGLPFIGDMVTQDPLLVDRSLEGGSGFVVADQDLNVYRKPFLTSSAAGRSLLAIVKNLNLAQAMAELEAGFANWNKPTLIVWGMADPWLSAEDAEKLASSLPNVELVRLEEGKHYPQEHWSKEISEELLNFLRRQAL
jgi:haloalkane dehalogenase